MNLQVAFLPRKRDDIAVWPSGEAGEYIARNRRTGEAFHLGRQEEFLLARFDGKHALEQICAAYEQTFGEPLSEEELEEFLHEVEARGFLAILNEDEAGSPPVLDIADSARRPACPPAFAPRFAARELTRLAAGLQWLAGGLNRAATKLHFYRLSRLDFIPRPDDIFIVTYPRSGTTWMQMILYQLTTDGSLDIPHIAEYVPWFENSLRSGRSFETRPAPRIFKSHLSYRHIPKGPCKYIYMARDGKDVALSNYHLWRSHLDRDIPFDEFFDRFLKGKIECGSWFKHVHEWWCRRDDPQVLFLRYEELKRDLEGTIRRIAAFCGINLSAERLSVIVDRCSFRFMKQHEDKFDPAMEYLWEQGVRLNCFIRNGRIGDGANELTGEQRARFDALYRQLWPENEPGMS